MKVNYTLRQNSTKVISPLRIAIIFLLMVVGSRAMAASLSQSKLQTLAHGVRAQAKELSTQINITSAGSKLPTTARIKTLIQSAQKYFLARTTYELLLFNELASNNSLRQFNNQNIKLKNRDSELRALLLYFQKYFSADIKNLKLSQLVQRRDLLQQIKSLDRGHLSGAVWLYDSPLTSFAISRLQKINAIIISESLSQAKYARSKHRYSSAQGLYQNLIKEYANTMDAAHIKVFLIQTIVEGFNYQSQIALAKHNYKSARTYLHKIIDGYPQTQYAAVARKQLEATIPIAVNYYKKVADQSFHPMGKIGVAQKKASIYYKLMYEEDPTGPKADYALYYWARALGTEGKIKEEAQLLEQHIDKFPKSDVRSEAMYLLGFTYCNNDLRNYKKGIPLLLQVAKEFPSSTQAPEALWHAAFILGWNNQYSKAIPLLQRLKKGYPKSPRTKWVDTWITKYKGAR